VTATHWQPIATAPRDGSLILLWLVPNDPEMITPTPTTGLQLRCVVFGRYAQAKRSFWDRDRLEGYRNLYATCGGSADDCPDICGWADISPTKYTPTHWRPMLEGPAA